MQISAISFATQFYAKPLELEKYKEEYEKIVTFACRKIDILSR